MKTRVTQALSVILTLVMLVSALPLSGAAAADYSVGDIIELGSYPQSKVTDSATLSALNAQTLNWVSYGYYSSVETGINYIMKQSDYMKYADVSYSGSKYRAVQFTAYRPSCTSYVSSADNTFQDENGYYTNTTYWFKFEPLQWRVLDPTAGLVVSEYGIDSQAYCNEIHTYGLIFNDSYRNNSNADANDYVTNSIRKWLNIDFYNTAFSDSEKAGLYARTLDNSSPHGDYSSASTTDKVFLLSYNEVCNSAYGFNSDPNNSDPARKVRGTDYAKCQGADIYDSANGVASWGYNTPRDEGIFHWWLRSPGSGLGRHAYVVNCDGETECYNVDYSNVAVRPALLLNPEPGNPEPDNPEGDNSFLGKIKAFFLSIINWFKNLFGR